MKEKLLDAEVSGLNDEQETQVRKQWEALQHEKETIDVKLSSFGDVLKGFVVHPQVWHPAKTSARYHASYLFFNNARLFRDKRALDMGTGTGLMGVVMAQYGAEHVILSDISRPAVLNAEENIKHFQLTERARVVEGDLFENVPKEKFDCIVFNQPFFSGTPEKGDTISASMLNPGELIDRFLETVGGFLSENGTIIMPSYSKAGDRNNPEIQGPEYGFKVQTTFVFNASQELQQGLLKIHELTRE